MGVVDWQCDCEQLSPSRPRRLGRDNQRHQGFLPGIGRHFVSDAAYQVRCAYADSRFHPGCRQERIQDLLVWSSGSDIRRFTGRCHSRQDNAGLPAPRTEGYASYIAASSKRRPNDDYEGRAAPAECACTVAGHWEGHGLCAGGIRDQGVSRADAGAVSADSHGEGCDAGFASAKRIECAQCGVEECRCGAGSWGAAELDLALWRGAEMVAQG